MVQGQGGLDNLRAVCKRRSRSFTAKCAKQRSENGTNVQMQSVERKLKKMNYPMTQFSKYGPLVIEKVR